MDRGAWQSLGLQRVRHNWACKNIPVCLIDMIRPYFLMLWTMNHKRETLRSRKLKWSWGGNQETFSCSSRMQCKLDPDILGPLGTCFFFFFLCPRDHSLATATDKPGWMPTGVYHRSVKSNRCNFSELSSSTAFPTPHLLFCSQHLWVSIQFSASWIAVLKTPNRLFSLFVAFCICWSKILTEMVC